MEGFTFDKILSAGVELGKARYASKVAQPYAAEVAPVAQTLIAPARPMEAENPGVVDRLKAGDVMTWAITLGVVGVAAFVGYKAIR